MQPWPREGSNLVKNRANRAKKKAVSVLLWKEAVIAAKEMLEKRGVKGKPLDSYVSRFYHILRTKRTRKKERE